MLGDFRLRVSGLRVGVCGRDGCGSVGGGSEYRGGHLKVAKTFEISRAARGSGVIYPGLLGRP